MGFAPVGKVDEVVVHDVVVEILRRHAHERPVDHPLEAGVVAVDGLDVETPLGVPVPLDADVTQPHVPGELAVAPVRIRYHDGAMRDFPSQDGRKIVMVGLAQVGNPSDGLSTKIDPGRNTDLLVGQSALGRLPSPSPGVSRHLERPALLVVSLVGNQLIRLVALHDTLEHDLVHHVGQGIQNLVPPDECSPQRNLADKRALAEGEFLDHAMDESHPRFHLFVAGKENGVFGKADGFPAILAEITLTAMPMSVFDDVGRAAMRANVDFLFGSKECFDGGGGDGLVRRGGGIHPCDEFLFLGFVCGLEELPHDFKLLVGDCHDVVLKSERTIAKSKGLVNRIL